MSAPSKRLLAVICSVVLSITLAVSTLLFVLHDTWVPSRLLALFALSLAIWACSAFAETGSWFPRPSAPKSAIRGILRALAGVAGVALLILVVVVCLGFGSERLPWRTVGALSGQYYLAIVAIHLAITGTWFPGPSEPRTKP
jgi:hypothetical protein